ncbi:hypothetical protein MUSASHINO07_06350 [Gemella sp. Musashino-2025]
MGQNDPTIKKINKKINIYIKYKNFIKDTSNTSISYNLSPLVILVITIITYLVIIYITIIKYQTIKKSIVITNV